MKKFFLFSVIFIFILSCRKDHSASMMGSAGTPAASSHSFSSLFRYSGSDYSQAISVDSANKMIESYLMSVDYPKKDSCLRSLSFDADTLRNYLNDTSHGHIVTLKFMLAHKLDYINDGKKGVNCGTNEGLTFVIVGLSEDGNYIYNKNERAYDHLRPCPSHCQDNEASYLTQ